MNFKQTSTMLVVILFLILGCDDPKEVAPKEPNQEEEIKILPVQLQVVGSLIEGMVVCDNNNSCKSTDNNGVVSFDKFGQYSFKINDINLSTLTIDTNKTILSPYTFFENNATLAKDFFLLLHAFDKGSNIADEKVALTFSSYIPTATTIEDFITTHLDGDDLLYSVNEHNITIDTEDNSIDRDDKSFDIDVPTKESYAKLQYISNFIEVAEDKNVTLSNLSTKYLLKGVTPTSFTLGERYRFTAYAKTEDVMVDIYDSTSRTTDKSKLIIDDNNQTLITNLVSVILVKQ